VKKAVICLTILVVSSGNVFAQKNGNIDKEKFGACFLGRDENCTFKFDPIFGVGIGVSMNSQGYSNGTFHFGGWWLPLRFGYLRFAGLGLICDIYDFGNHSGVTRDWARNEGSYLNMEWTFMPVRFGPLAYQFTWDSNVHSLGFNRGRLHMISFDFVGLMEP